MGLKALLAARLASAAHERVALAFDVGPLAGRARASDGRRGDARIARLRRRSRRCRLHHVLPTRPQRAPGVCQSRRWWPPLVGPRRQARVDRLLGKPDVVHGTNYVVPPSRAHRVVSVYDCWFLRYPSLASRDVHRSGRVLRRAIEHGATVHASSAATAEESPICSQALGSPRSPWQRYRSRAATSPRCGAGRPPFIARSAHWSAKEPRVLVEAFGLLASERDEILLVLAGATAMTGGPSMRPSIDSTRPPRGAW